MKKICNFLAIVIGLGCTGAWAGETTNGNSVLNHKISIYGGVQLYNADGKFSSNRDGLPKSTVDLDDLDLTENPVTPVLGARVNLGKKWSLRFDYFGYHDDSNTIAEKEFYFDDEFVTVGARIDSSLDLDVYVVNLSYNFISTERARFGVGAGVHFADIDLAISAQASVNGVPQAEEETGIEFTGPLPNLYVSGAYAFTDRFILAYYGGWVSLSYDEYDGELLFFNACLEYWPFKHAGIGAGYRYLKANIEYDPGNKRENYDVELPGPMLYATFGF